MQAVIDIVLFALLIFPFGALMWSRPDDRLRCWAGGWACILVHFFVELWNPASAIAKSLKLCLSIDILALAGIFFVVSSVILFEGRKTSLRLVWLLSAITLPCLSYALAGGRQTWILASMIALRQLVVFITAGRPRPCRSVVAPLIFTAGTACGFWMVYGALHQRNEILIAAILSELYLVTAIDFWNNGWKNTLPLNMVAIGFVAWAAVFPLSFLVPRFWVLTEIQHDWWNIPKACVAVGMILVVVREDSQVIQDLNYEYRIMFQNNPTPLWIFEPATLKIIEANQAALNLHGYTHREFLQLTLLDIVDPLCANDIRGETLLREPKCNRSSRHVRKDGVIIPLDLQVHNILFHGKQCRFVVGIDVRERDALEHQLRYQDQHDSLTGLMNRKSFDDRFRESVMQAVATNEALAILCIDIARLKRVNDGYGVEVGDACIRHVASSLASKISAQDILARTGGDEFALVLTHLKSVATAELVISGLREAYSVPVDVNGELVQLSFSIGLAICPDDGVDPIQLWMGAEGALRRSQAQGGGISTWLAPDLKREAEEFIKIESALRDDLDQPVFYLVYQPFFNFRGQVRGAEALLRLDHPTLGKVSPAKVVSVAEESGLIEKLGLWTIEEVCQQIQAWKREGIEIGAIAVNVSALQLKQDGFAEKVVQLLDRYQVPSTAIRFELTETAIMNDVVQTHLQMRTLAACGFTFSIDDFGTGYSSLSRLRDLPISEVKIDRSFVEQLTGSENPTSTRSIVQAIVSMSHALGDNVIAEGVETTEQLSLVHAAGCDLVQGFLLSFPVKPEFIPAIAAVDHVAFHSMSDLV